MVAGQINTHYGTFPPTNNSATPVVRNVTVRNVALRSGEMIQRVLLDQLTPIKQLATST